MFEEFFQKFHISSQQVKIFIGTFLAMFIMVSLQYLGVRLSLKIPKLVVPFPKNTQIMDKIRPKLEQKSNNFELKKSPQLIPSVHAASEFENAASYSVVDLDTGEILAEKNGNRRLPIASLTKIMTAVVSLDLAEPAELFTVTDKAVKVEPTTLGIIPGEKMSLEELLNGVLLTSANDATEEIRDGVNKKYNDDIFIKAMNEKAAYLGLTDTHFTNPQGFDDEGNYSSVEDLTKLTQYALINYPLFASIVKKDYQLLPPNQNHKQFDLYNWNGLVNVYPDVQGVKIGNTDDAGKTTIVLSTREGKKMLAVVLGAPGIVERDAWAAQLLDIGYKKTLGLVPVNVTEDQLKQKYSTWKYWN